jgi:hypothetical protein
MTDIVFPENPSVHIRYTKRIILMEEIGYRFKDNIESPQLYPGGKNPRRMT